jgi:hypothetical protein
LQVQVGGMISGVVAWFLNLAVLGALTAYERSQAAAAGGAAAADTGRSGHVALVADLLRRREEGDVSDGGGATDHHGRQSSGGGGLLGREPSGSGWYLGLVAGLSLLATPFYFSRDDERASPAPIVLGVPTWLLASVMFSLGLSFVTLWGAQRLWLDGPEAAAAEAAEEEEAAAEQEMMRLQGGAAMEAGGCPKSMQRPKVLVGLTAASACLLLVVASLAVATVPHGADGRHTRPHQGSSGAPDMEEAAADSSSAGGSPISAWVGLAACCALAATVFVPRMRARQAVGVAAE